MPGGVGAPTRIVASNRAAAAGRGRVKYSRFHLGAGNKKIAAGANPVSLKTGTGFGEGGGVFDVLLASFYLANMADALEAATGATKMFLEFQGVSTDNMTFKLFYRVTTTLLILASVLATSKQIFGDPISCGLVRMSTVFKQCFLKKAFLIFLSLSFLTLLSALAK